jgi:hypothetical protein
MLCLLVRLQPAPRWPQPQHPTEAALLPQAVHHRNQLRRTGWRALSLRRPGRAGVHDVGHGRARGLLGDRAHFGQHLAGLGPLVTQGGARLNPGPSGNGGSNTKKKRSPTRASRPRAHGSRDRHGPERSNPASLCGHGALALSKKSQRNIAVVRSQRQAASSAPRLGCRLPHDISGPQGKSEDQPHAKQIAPAKGVTPPAEVHACPFYVGLTHGSVSHSRTPASRSSGGFMIPTTPCPPGCMWTCRTSTVCLLPRR